MSAAENRSFRGMATDLDGADPLFMPPNANDLLVQLEDAVTGRAVNIDATSVVMEALGVTREQALALLRERWTPAPAQ